MYQEVKIYIMFASDKADLRTRSMMIVALLAYFAVRGCPQQWDMFVQNLLVGFGLVSVGVKICLECLKLITKDCTDNYFNSEASMNCE